MSRGNHWLWSGGKLVYAFLYIPLAIVVMYSFNDSRLNAEWVGFTLSWYKALFNNTEMLIAARNSLIIALSASFRATVLGTMAGLAIHRYKLRYCRYWCLRQWQCPKFCWAYHCCYSFCKCLI